MTSCSLLRWWFIVGTQGFSIRFTVFVESSVTNRIHGMGFDDGWWLSSEIWCHGNWPWYNTCNILFPMFSTFWAWKAPGLVCLLSTIYRRFHVLQNKLKITPSCQKLSYKRSISSKISINSTPIFRLNAYLFAKLEISCVCFESSVQNRFNKWWLLKKKEKKETKSNYELINIWLVLLFLKI